MDEDILIPIIMFGSAAFILWKFFDTKHKERMAIIDRGMVTEDLKYLYTRGASKPNRFGALKYGLAVFLIGMALLLAIPMQDTSWGREHRPEIIIGLICAGGGVGFLLYYFIVSRWERNGA